VKNHVVKNVDEELSVDIKKKSEQKPSLDG